MESLCETDLKIIHNSSGSLLIEHIPNMGTESVTCVYQFSQNLSRKVRA
jgi:hypothetical protein